MLHVEEALIAPEIRRIEVSREEVKLLNRLRQLTRQHGSIVLLVESNRESLRWRLVGRVEG